VEDTENSPDPQGQATLDAVMRAVYAHGDEWRKDFGPVALPSSNKNTFTGLFSYNVYHGGALVLYALRQKIGTPAFERLERTWVQRYAGRSASTDDFIALAAEISGRSDVPAFMRDWVYGTTTPPMPGHPDWTVAASGASGTAAPAASGRRRTGSRTN
jgi:aminopeptidase N